MPTEYVTSPVGYVRLTGRNYDQWFDADTGADSYNYLDSEVELAGSKEKIVRIAGKAEVTYVVTNNTSKAKRGQRAATQKHAHRTPRKAPEPLLKHYPELNKIADPIYDDIANPDLPLLA